LTGHLIDDISYIEDDLINDFKLFMNAYYKLKIKRKNFLNMQYILYQLLKRRGHPCDMQNFTLPKTEGCKLFHDEICQKVFDDLCRV